MKKKLFAIVFLLGFMGSFFKAHAVDTLCDQVFDQLYLMRECNPLPGQQGCIAFDVVLTMRTDGRCQMEASSIVGEANARSPISLTGHGEEVRGFWNLGIATVTVTANSSHISVPISQSSYDRALSRYEQIGLLINRTSGGPITKQISITHFTVEGLSMGEEDPEDPEDPEPCPGGSAPNAGGVCTCPEGQEWGDTDGDGACVEAAPAIPCGGTCVEGEERCDATTNACVPEDSEIIDDPIDRDGIAFDVDNCPGTANADQLDSDNDDLGDVCDRCPLIAEDADIDGEEAEFRAMPAAGCPAGVAPTQGRSVGGGPQGPTGGGSGGGGCSSIASGQGTAAPFFTLGLILILLARRIALPFDRLRANKTASRNSRG